MARQIIVLDTNPADGGNITVKVVFWYQIPQGRQIPKPSFQSAVDNSLAGAGAVNATEIAALQNGAMLEEVFLRTFPNTYTSAQIKAELQSFWATRNTYVQGLPNPIAFYGVSFDGTAWSA